VHDIRLWLNLLQTQIRESENILSNLIPNHLHWMDDLGTARVPKLNNAVRLHNDSVMRATADGILIKRDNCHPVQTHTANFNLQG